MRYEKWEYDYCPNCGGPESGGFVVLDSFNRTFAICPEEEQAKNIVERVDLIPEKCDYCGKKWFIPSEHRSAFCPYCGNS